MDNRTRALMMGAAGAGEKIYVEDIFSTWLYTGTGSTQTITNGIDLSGKGGLVWIKNRNISYGENHALYDSERGIGSNLVYKDLSTDSTASQQDRLTVGLSSFNNDGFTVIGNNAQFNTSPNTYASWTFRKQAKFFDVVTYTGNGSAQAIAHNLGSVPGCIIVKNLGTATNWEVYHRGLDSSAPQNYKIELNSPDARQTNANTWNNTAPTSSVFTVGTNNSANGANYVAYLFAHDAGGFGDSGNDSVIKCGSYTGNGSATGPVIDLGWEPQWLLIKRATTSTADWLLFDNMRLFANTTSGDSANDIRPNQAVAEGAARWLLSSATGFQPATTSAAINASGDTYIYIAIRRGPMKTPTDATKVFKADETAVSTRFSTGFAAVDLSIQKRQDLAGTQWFWASRLTGNTNALSSDSTAAEAAASSGAWEFDLSGQYEQNYVVNPIMYLLRRAPGFFDVVCYTGTGSATTVSHNLGVVPELIIFKDRTTTTDWITYNATLGNTKAIYLNYSVAESTSSAYWNSTTPTSTVFSLGTGSDANNNGDNFIAYLFATCPGVSKVGSYTGTGATQQIDCGFTNGARFVLIKRTDSTGDWYVWDTARGIIAGDDPYLLLNSTAAEVTNTDYIDTYSAGFEISSTAPAAINSNGGSFIFLAIA